MSLLKVNEIQIFNGTTVTITATTTEISADMNVGADLDVTGALTLGTALAVAEGGTGATDAATARTNLDVDQAGTDNSTDCTLITTSHDYLSIAGQAITLGPIDLAADVTGTLATSNGGTGVTSLGSLDAADLGSGAATDGYVLTADGAGGAAWEAASGGAASLPIDLLSSGASIRKSDGTTAVLSESGGDVNLTNISSAEVTNIQATSGQSLTIKDEDGNAAIIIGTDNTAHTYLSLNFGSYHGDSGGAGSGTRTGNTLDDYEEGTWTPAYAFSTSGSVTPFLTSGAYTKIGNFVLVTFRIATSALSSPSGAVTINGLPFTSAGTNSGVTPGQVTGFGIDAPIRCQIGPSSSSISLLKNASNGTAVGLQGADFASGSAKNLIDCSFSYRV